MVSTASLPLLMCRKIGQNVADTANFEEVQIGFDYDRLPKNVFWKTFVSRFGEDARSGLRFDSVLQYVTFPRVEVTLKGPKADRQRDADRRSGARQLGPLGRNDMLHFFDWLYTKGVRHIIRVVVDDSGDSAAKVHTDEAIQESLEKFVVDHLDWKKPDLDPETILHVSSKVRKEGSTLENPDTAEPVPDRQLSHLCLRWSGSSAVLRAWSELEGLAMLPRLKKISLSLSHADKVRALQANRSLFLFCCFSSNRVSDRDKAPNSMPWLNAKVDAFEQRLNANRRVFRMQAQKQQQPELTISDSTLTADVSGEFGDVVVDRNLSDEAEHNAISHDARHSISPAPATGVKPHRWLDSTAKFASLMIPFWKNTLDSFGDQRTQDGLENDVVVALIDDGVNMFDTLQANQILEGKSFDFHHGMVRPAFSSARGRGTVMASMILRVCPMAKIYPIRLKTDDSPDGNAMQIDAGYAAQVRSGINLHDGGAHPRVTLTCGLTGDPGGFGQEGYDHLNVVDNPEGRQ